jgi:hypothetical protein
MRHPKTTTNPWKEQCEINAPLPALAPYERCRCGKCRECHDNRKWDEIFAKFATDDDRWDTRGMFQSTLRGW